MVNGEWRMVPACVQPCVRACALERACGSMRTQCMMVAMVQACVCVRVACVCACVRAGKGDGRRFLQSIGDPVAFVRRERLEARHVGEELLVLLLLLHSDPTACSMQRQHATDRVKS